MSDQNGNVIRMEKGRIPLKILKKKREGMKSIEEPNKIWQDVTERYRAGH